MEMLNQALAQFKDLYRSMTPGARITTALLLVAVGVSLGYLFTYRGTSADLYLMNGESLPPSQLPAMEAARDCLFRCDPTEVHHLCERCAERMKAGEALPTQSVKMRVVELPVSATEDRVVGTLDIERAIQCVEAGADMIFPEAITELGMYRQFADAVNVPILANITEFGATPLYSQQELGEAGVSLVLYPLSSFRAASKAALGVYEAIRRDGHQQNVVDTMQTRMELYDFLGYHDYEQKLDQLFSQNK